MKARSILYRGSPLLLSLLTFTPTQAAAEMRALCTRTTLFFFAYTLGTAVWGILVGEPSPRAVRLGDTVTLPCDLQLTHETAWFILRNGTLSVGVFTSRNPGEQQERPFTYKRRPDSRLSLVLNPSTDSPDLRIENVKETDQGVYYCAAKDKGGINIGNAISLHEEKEREAPSPPQHPEIGLPCLIVLLSALPLSALASSCCVFFILLRRRGKRRRKDHQNGPRSHEVAVPVLST